MTLFEINNELEKLELLEEWEKAKILLYDIWNKDKTNLGNLLRVGTECWYVMTFWELIKTDCLIRESFSVPLTEMKNFGENSFGSSDSFLWVFGYMISLFPYWFDDFDGDLQKWESKGKNMIRKAWQLQPNNLIAKMLCLSEENIEYAQTCNEVSSILGEYFTGDSAIEKYFKEVLKRNP